MLWRGVSGSVGNVGLQKWHATSVDPRCLPNSAFRSREPTANFIDLHIYSCFILPKFLDMVFNQANVALYEVC